MRHRYGISGAGARPECARDGTVHGLNFRLPTGELMIFFQLSSQYPRSWEVQRLSATPNPEEAYGSVLAHVRCISLLPQFVAGYMSGPYQLQAEDDAIISFLKGMPPRLEVEHPTYVDAVFLATKEPLVPFRYPRLVPAGAQAVDAGSGELYFVAPEGSSVNSSLKLGGLCEQLELGPVSLWVRAVNAERKARAQTGYLRPWSLTYFAAVPVNARSQWFVPQFS